MQITYLVPTIGYRGGERYAALLASGLKKAGFSTTLIAARVEKNHLELPKNLKVVTPKPFLNNFLQRNLMVYIFTFPISLFLLLKTGPTDLIETDSGFCLWAAVIASKIIGCKVLWVTHFSFRNETDEINSNVLIRLYLKLYYWIDSFFVHKVFAIKTVIPDEIELIKNKFPGKMVFGFYPALDFERFRAIKDRSRESSNPKNPTTILVCGVLHPKKNQELVINAIKQAAGKNKNIQLLLIGDGNDKERLIGIVKKLNIENYVVFVGSKTGRELANFYQKSDIVVVPYYKSEGLTVVPFEAMLFGKHVVIAAGSAAAHVIKNYNLGSVVKPNANIVANEILRYLSNRSKFESMNTRGEKWTLINMSPRNVLKKNIAAYNEIFKAI